MMIESVEQYFFTILFTIWLIGITIIDYRNQKNTKDKMDNFLTCIVSLAEGMEALDEFAANHIKEHKQEQDAGG